MGFRFCPECGTLLSARLAGDDGLVPYCEKCARFWFDMFPSCVIVLVANEKNEIALIRQSYLSDEFDVFVSGFISRGESAEDAAVREVKEELGLNTEQLISTGTFWYPEQGQLMHGFIANVKKQSLILSSELDQAYWVAAEDACKTMFPASASPAAYEIYKEYLRLKSDQKD